MGETECACARTFNHFKKKKKPKTECECPPEEGYGVPHAPVSVLYSHQPVSLEPTTYEVPAYQPAPAPVDPHAPAPSYQAPAPSYQAPAPTYQAPAPGYQAPELSYGFSPIQNYQRFEEAPPQPLRANFQ